MGTRRGLQSNILDAADLSYADNGSEIVLAESQIETKRALTKAVYPDYDVLGWYTIAENLEPLHTRIHECLSSYVDSPLFLLMKPLGLGETPDVYSHQEEEGTDGADALPLTVYETDPSRSTFGFASLAFQLETAEAEQISIEHVAKVTPKSGITKTELHLRSLITSLMTLQARVQVLTDYLDEIGQRAEVEPSPSLLRSVAQLANLLPPVNEEAFEVGRTGTATFGSAIGASVTDGLITANLALMSNASLMLSKLSDKFSLAYESHMR